MTTYDVGDIVLVNFPELDSGLTKRRPAVVVLDIGAADLVLAPITSRVRSGAGDCQLRDWATSGLLRESWVRLAKTTCLSKSAVSRFLGQLSLTDRTELARQFQLLYDLSGRP